MKNIILILILFIILPQTARAETTYDRVLRTGVIRCGYMLWPPYFDRDPASRKFSGMNYDYVEALGRNLGLKIDWAMEVTLGEQVEALRTGKIDALCGSEGPVMPSTTKYLTYSSPLVYTPFYLYARADDLRFDKDWMQFINRDSVRISVIDGDVSGQTARVLFPQAKTVAIPQLGTPSQMMMDVIGNKADIVINEPLSMETYLRYNRNGLKRIGGDFPVVIVPNTLSFLRNDANLTLIDLMNQAIENLKNSGEEDLILKPYLDARDGEPAFFRTAKLFAP